MFDIHYGDVMMGTIASQITSFTIVYSTAYSSVDQRKHQSSASLAFVRGIHRGPVNSPHKWPVTRNFFPFDDVIMTYKTYLAPACMSVNWVNIGLVNGSSLSRHKALAQTNVGYFKTKTFVVCRMSPILYRPRCVDRSVLKWSSPKFWQPRWNRELS